MMQKNKTCTVTSEHIHQLSLLLSSYTHIHAHTNSPEKTVVRALT